MPGLINLHSHRSAWRQQKGTDGKASIWRASFGCSNRNTVLNRTCGPELIRLTLPRAESPPERRTITRRIMPSTLKFPKGIDSDKAYEVAQKHGGDKIAGTPVTYLLEWAAGENNLVWHVIYGPSRNDAKLVVDVDATTGEFIRKEK